MAALSWSWVTRGYQVFERGGDLLFEGEEVVVEVDDAGEEVADDLAVWPEDVSDVEGLGDAHLLESPRNRFDLQSECDACSAGAFGLDVLEGFFGSDLDESGEHLVSRAYVVERVGGHFGVETGESSLVFDDEVVAGEEREDLRKAELYEVLRRAGFS